MGEDKAEKKYARVGLQTSILPVEVSLEDEVSNGVEMQVITFRADKWSELEAVIQTFQNELDGLREDVTREREQESA